MELSEFFKKKKRMCLLSGCQDCPIAKIDIKKSCNEIISLYTKDAERIVLEFSNNHPQLLVYDKMQEIFGEGINEDILAGKDMYGWLASKYHPQCGKEDERWTT